jgi:hypothetical protein
VTGLYITCPISWYANKWMLALEGGEAQEGLPFAPPPNPDVQSSGQAQIIITSKTKKEKKHG